MFRLFLFAIVATAFSYALPDVVTEKEITGKITWTGKDHHIDPSWKVHVELHDKDEKHKDDILIASTLVRDAKTFPISYTLKYKPSDIKPEHSYWLFVRINGSTDHNLLFTNDDGKTVVFTDGKPPVVDIAIHKVGKKGSKDCSPVKCTTACEYGHEKKDGCETCKCRDPCKNKKCESKEKCVVVKKDNGKFKAHCEAAPSKRAENEPKTLTKEDCKLPQVVGPCRRADLRFWYNSEIKECLQFTYGGCKGNANNFKTQEECKKLCLA